MNWSLYLLVLISGCVCLSGEITIKPDSQPNGSTALSREELNRKESKDFIEKCLTLNNFAEVTLEYEAQMKAKFPNRYKTKIFMTAAAATSKYDKKYFLREFGRRSFISVDDFLYMFCLLCQLDYEQQDNIILIKKKEDRIINLPEGKYKLEWINELPEKIFIIEEKFLNNRESRDSCIIVIDGMQFKDFSSAFDYINKQPLLRFKDGILFRFTSPAHSILSDDLFEKTLGWAKEHDIILYKFHPYGALTPGIFQKYIFQSPAQYKETPRD